MALAGIPLSQAGLPTGVLAWTLDKLRVLKFIPVVTPPPGGPITYYIYGF